VSCSAGRAATPVSFGLGPDGAARGGGGKQAHGRGPWGLGRVYRESRKPRTRSHRPEAVRARAFRETREPGNGNVPGTHNITAHRKYETPPLSALFTPWASLRAEQLCCHLFSLGGGERDRVFTHILSRLQVKPHRDKNELCSADRWIRDERDGHRNGATESERNGLSRGTGVALSPSLPQHGEPGLGTPSVSSHATTPDEFSPKTNSKDAGSALDLGRTQKEQEVSQTPEATRV
jgi:hypothetical protein